MTNAEKAQELVSNPANDYKSTEDLCRMMAEWKDKQLSEFLDKLQMENIIEPHYIMACIRKNLLNI